MARKTKTPTDQVPKKDRKARQKAERAMKRLDKTMDKLQVRLGAAVDQLDAAQRLAVERDRTQLAARLADLQALDHLAGLAQVLSDADPGSLAPALRELRHAPAALLRELSRLMGLQPLVAIGAPVTVTLAAADDYRWTRQLEPEAFPVQAEAIAPGWRCGDTVIAKPTMRPVIQSAAVD